MDEYMDNMMVTTTDIRNQRNQIKYTWWQTILYFDKFLQHSEEINEEEICGRWNLERVYQLFYHFPSYFQKLWM